MIITLISAVALLTILSNLVWVPLIPCAIMCVYTLAYRPYKNFGDNIRSSFNLIVMSAFLGLRMYVSQCTLHQLKSEFMMILVIIGYILLFVVLLVGLISAIYYYREEQNKILQT